MNGEDSIEVCRPTIDLCGRPSPLTSLSSRREPREFSTTLLSPLPPRPQCAVHTTPGLSVLKIAILTGYLCAMICGFFERACF
ncbi:hypothetical protein L218DRAFT_729990 [Marasmius fiardii PR-910]|nr:hypothetical protein L218DRAFT_729990 [Marasmius fiardii PR-910]